nr:YrhB domain-containing protein [uncultured Duganella sp.]
MDAINQNEAWDIALSKVQELGRASGGDFEILAEETRTIELGWVFFYNSSNFVRTGDIKFALAGNGSLLVTKDGQISCLPTASPWEDVVGKMARSASGRAV